MTDMDCDNTIEQHIITESANIVEMLGILGPEYVDRNSIEQQKIIARLEAALEMLGK